MPRYLIGLPLAAPIGLSPPLILTFRGPERVLVVSRGGGGHPSYPPQRCAGPTTPMPHGPPHLRRALGQWCGPPDGVDGCGPPTGGRQTGHECTDTPAPPRHAAGGRGGMLEHRAVRGAQGQQWSCGGGGGGGPETP